MIRSINNMVSLENSAFLFTRLFLHRSKLCKASWILLFFWFVFLCFWSLFTLCRKQINPKLIVSVFHIWKISWIFNHFKWKIRFYEMLTFSRQTAKERSRETAMSINIFWGDRMPSADRVSHIWHSIVLPKLLSLVTRSGCSCTQTHTQNAKK